jgi:hypothetical protein
VFTLAANLFGDDVQEHGRVAADLGVRVRLLLLVMPVQRPGCQKKNEAFSGGSINEIHSICHAQLVPMHDETMCVAQAGQL